ncbi:MAG: ATP-binding protein [Myxococcota bacterium]|nr:ATP-binding protein [Myxococcota bacterium]
MAGFGVAYLLLAQLSYGASFLPEGALAAWWAPSGLALAVLFLAERRNCPWYLGAILLVSTAVNAFQQIGPFPVLYRSLADVAEPLVSSLILRRMFGNELRLGTLPEVLGFAVVGGVLGPAVGAVVVTVGTLFDNPSQLSAGMFGLAWFGSATLGSMLFAPVILTWQGRFRRLRPSRWVEAGALGLSLGAVAVAAMLIRPSSALSLLLGFAAFPPLVWSALRFGPSGAARAVVVISLCSLWPFAAWHPQLAAWQIIFCQGIYALGVLTALSLSALTEEAARQRRLAQAQTQRTEESLALVERAYQEAREALQLREDFLSIASHELKTPLTPLAARLSFLQRRLAAGHTLSPESIDKPLQSLRKLTELINDLLDTSQIEHGRLQIHPQPQPLEEILRLGVDPFRKGSPLHRLVVDVPPEALWVEADRERMAQVVANLVDNAIKYSPSGGEVRVRLRPHPEGVELTVSDQGIGIPADQQTRLFERFYRAANSGVSYGGLGLGLYITHDIVELHHGRIWVESTPGEGSTFHVVLPRLAHAEVWESLH